MGTISVPTTLSVSPATIAAGAAANLSIGFGGLAPSAFVESHERILHLVSLGSDLDTFSHTHPEDFGAPASGTCPSMQATLPRPRPQAGELTRNRSPQAARRLSLRA
jgi:hypothetical protein